ncbi:MAG TPA: HAMP domain-containing sensor histidine kinase, partial [Solirubrobacteraceae bacterium]|nr:HAMP domain-containing sensor histidine kinase [Solirubrobacteraceae bacterium]
GFSELMDAGRTGPLSRRQHEFLGIIRSSAGHLLTLINEVLDLSRIESGHMRLDPEAVDPVAVAEECVRAMRWLAADRQVRLELQAAADGAVCLDPGRLRQVILNLLSNAIKFTGAEGRVTLTVARDGDRLLLAVADTGVGISAADQRRIFDEFVQVGETADAGSGLGLAVTREIVCAQGGEISVDSELGRGSTFSAWLPWVPAPAGAPERPAETPSPFDRPTAGAPARRGDRRFRPGASERVPAGRGASSR